jgi:disintegrin and metalloproteinase domain-containing protein 10
MLISSGYARRALAGANIGRCRATTVTSELPKQGLFASWRPTMTRSPLLLLPLALVLALVPGLSRGAPAPSGNSALSPLGGEADLTGTIARFEWLHLRTDELELQHQRLRRHAAAAASAARHAPDAETAEPDLQVSFAAFGRTFHLSLRPAPGVFMPNADFVVHDANGARRIDIDPSRFYSGHLCAGPGAHRRDVVDSSFVHAVVSSSGGFMAAIHADDDVYYVTPTEHVRQQQRDDEVPVSNVIYRLSDVVVRNSSGICALSPANPALGAIEQFQETLHLTMDHALRAARRQQGHSSAADEEPLSRARRGFFPTSKVCTLTLVADHTFYDQYKGSTDCEACSFEKMVFFTTEARAIFQATNFNGVTGVDFAIAGAETFTSASASNYFLKDTAVPGEVLNILQTFARYGATKNYDGVCLGFLFTRRNFNNGVLGLAFLADQNNAGGICQDKLNFSPWATSGANTNVGLLTVINNGQIVADAVSSLTMAHELGHNFGSPHDPEGVCQPGETAGGQVRARAHTHEREVE